MKSVASKRSAAKRQSALAIAGAGEAPYPGFVEFCDPTLREKPPAGREWLHEIKIDGYRAQVHIHAGQVTVYSRGGYDWTRQFATIARAAEALRADDAIIDGEIRCSARPGCPTSRRCGANPNSKRLIYHAFDLLYLNGRDLRPLPLIERKAALRKRLAKAPAALIYVEHLETDGETVFKHVCGMGLEGIVSKRRDAPYRSGQRETWIKVKCTKSDTFPIVAFVEKLGARPRKIASLYLGKRVNGRLLYAGKARTGYTEAVAREVRERLDPLIRKRSPLAAPMKKRRGSSP
jgi:bifunctional non-homologous end joining protein LigD